MSEEEIQMDCEKTEKRNFQEDFEYCCTLL